MATVRGVNLNGRGIDVDDSNFRDMSGFQITTNTSTQIVLTFSSTGEKTIFTGTGLSVNEATGQASGTVTSIAYQLNNQTLVTYEDSSFPASNIVTYYVNNDADGYLNYIGAGADSFIGTTANELMRLYDGNDTFQGGGGNDQLFGGNGIDTAMFTGNRADYTISGTSTHTVADSQTTRDGTDTLTNVERIKFADGTLAYDLDGAAGQTYRLYKAAFNRTPDEAGLSHNVNLMDGGMSILDMASAFIGSQEFQNTYGTNVDNTAFLTLLYQNVLNRGPDDAGLAGWLSQMNSGTSREQVLFGFSESGENKAAVLGAIDDGIWLV